MVPRDHAFDLPSFSFLQAERPDTMLGVVCGALHVADVSLRNSISNFLHSLERQALFLTGCASSESKFSTESKFKDPFILFCFWQLVSATCYLLTMEAGQRRNVGVYDKLITLGLYCRFQNLVYTTVGMGCFLKTGFLLK